MQKSPFYLSLIVSCKGVLWILEKNLKALRGQSLSSALVEAIFVFDRKTKSLSPCISLIKNYFPNGQFVFLPRGKPIYEMRNLGMKQASAPYIYFIDEDVILQNSNHLSLLIQLHKKLPQYTAIGGGYLDHQLSSFWGKAYNRIAMLWIKNRPGFVPAGNLSIKMAKPFKACFHSPNPDGFGGEETAFLQMLEEEGKKSLYHSEMDAEHLAIHSLRDFIKRALAHGASLSFEKKRRLSLSLFFKMKAGGVGIKTGVLFYLLIVRLSALIYKLQSMFKRLVFFSSQRR